jgi:hypothetical protein
MAFILFNFGAIIVGNIVGYATMGAIANNINEDWYAVGKSGKFDITEFIGDQITTVPAILASVFVVGILLRNQVNPVVALAYTVFAGVMLKLSLATSSFLFNIAQLWGEYAWFLNLFIIAILSIFTLFFLWTFVEFGTGVKDYDF